MNLGNNKLLLALFFAYCVVAGIAFGFFINRVSGPRHDMPMLIINPDINTPYKHPAIVKLHDMSTGDFFCSGSVIAKNYIVTAGHCLYGRNRYKPSIMIKDMQGEDTKVVGTAAYYEGRTDRGLITGDFSEFNALMVSFLPSVELTAYMQQDKMILACGFPYGGDFFCSSFMNREQYVFQLLGKGFLYPGMSGGPVMDPQSGFMIGVNSAVLENGIIISPLVELLAGAGVKIEPTKEN